METDLRKVKNLQIKNLLLKLCIGSEQNRVTCEAEIEDIIQSRSFRQYFDRYAQVYKKIHEDYFKITKPRNGLRWTIENGLKILDVEFFDPGAEHLRNFIKNTLEGAWQGPGWGVRIRFSSYDGVNLEFDSEKTSRAEMGGGTIWMNIEGDTLESELTKLTLVHEFGHILGFPDCYVEFFDDTTGQIVYYHLEDKNIMCNLVVDGITEKHFKELRRVYSE